MNNVLYVVVDLLARKQRPASFTALTYTKALHSALHGALHSALHDALHSALQRALHSALYRADLHQGNT